MPYGKIPKTELKRAVRGFYEREGIERVDCAEWLGAENAEKFRLKTRYFDMPAGRREWILDSLARRILPAAEFCAGKESPYVLDAGCGTGSESICLALLGARVLGVDLRADRLEIAQKRAERYSASGMKGRADFILKNIFELAPGAPLDAVWANESVSHIAPAEKFIEKCAEWLAPGGRLFIAEHNAAHLYNQATRFRMRGAHVHDSYLDETTGRRVDYAKERVFTTGGLARALECAGLKVVETHYSKYVPGFLASGPAAAVLAGIERSLSRSGFMGGLLAGAYVMVAEK